jgi:hypothetical protein
VQFAKAASLIVQSTTDAAYWARCQLLDLCLSGVLAAMQAVINAWCFGIDCFRRLARWRYRWALYWRRPRAAVGQLFAYTNAPVLVYFRHATSRRARRSYRLRLRRRPSVLWRYGMWAGRRRQQLRRQSRAPQWLRCGATLVQSFVFHRACFELGNKTWSLPASRSEAARFLGELLPLAEEWRTAGTSTAFVIRFGRAAHARPTTSAYVGLIRASLWRRFVGRFRRRRAASADQPMATSAAGDLDNLSCSSSSTATAKHPFRGRCSTGLHRDSLHREHDASGYYTGLEKVSIGDSIIWTSKDSESEGIMSSWDPVPMHTATASNNNNNNTASNNNNQAAAAAADCLPTTSAAAGDVKRGSNAGGTAAAGGRTPKSRPMASRSPFSFHAACILVFVLLLTLPTSARATGDDSDPPRPTTAPMDALLLQLSAAGAYAWNEVAFRAGSFAHDLRDLEFSAMAAPAFALARGAAAATGMFFGMQPAAWGQAGPSGTQWVPQPMETDVLIDSFASLPYGMDLPVAAAPTATPVVPQPSPTSTSMLGARAMPFTSAPPAKRTTFGENAARFDGLDLDAFTADATDIAALETAAALETSGGPASVRNAQASASMTPRLAARKTYACGQCGRSGHNYRTCPSRTGSATNEINPPSSIQCCGICGEPGHNARTCAGRKRSGPSHQNAVMSESPRNILLSTALPSTGRGPNAPAHPRGLPAASRPQSFLRGSEMATTRPATSPNMSVPVLQSPILRPFPLGDGAYGDAIMPFSQRRICRNCGQPGHDVRSCESGTDLLANLQDYITRLGVNVNVRDVGWTSEPVKIESSTALERRFISPPSYLKPSEIYKSFEDAHKAICEELADRARPDPPQSVAGHLRKLLDACYAPFNAADYPADCDALLERDIKIAQTMRDTMADLTPNTCCAVCACRSPKRETSTKKLSEVISRRCGGLSR